jgi:hypothetical protein
MLQIVLKLKNPFSSWMIYPFACAFAVIGAKCWMIDCYGSPTPFWDQWEAEGAFLYPRFLSGTLDFFDLIALHNEHRILVTRLWSLLLLGLEGYWDPILQMLANTLILGAIVVLFVAVLRPILDHTSWIVFVLFSLVSFSLPFGWENTLAGFSSQWYFLLLFSIAGLVTIIDAAALTLRWWLATLLLIASYFCMAGGVLTVAAAFAVCVVQFAVGRRSGLVELLALAVLGVVTAAMVRSTPVLEGDAPLRAHSIGQFVRALLQIASWPPLPGRQPAIIDLLRAALINAPALLVSIHVIRLRPSLADRRWLLLALAGWAALQAAAIAYGRATGHPTSSRYLDVFAIALLLNGVCLLYLLRIFKESWLRRRIAFFAIALWMLLIVLGGTTHTLRYSVPELANKGVTGRAGTENLRAYLDTKDITVLENKPPLHIPYPEAHRLAAIVSMPVIRALLPPALVGEAGAARAQERGLARFTGRTVEAIKEYLLRWGALLMPAGAILFVLGLAAQRRRREMKPAPSRT